MEEKISSDLELAESSRQGFRKTVDQLHDRASAILSLTSEWKELEDQFDSAQQNMEQRAQELLAIKESNDKRSRELEAKEKELETIQESVKERIRMVEVTEKEIGLRQEKEAEIMSRKIESFEKSKREIEAMRESTERKVRELEEREDMCELFSNSVEERSDGVNERLREVEEKEKQYNQSCNKLKLKETQVEEQFKELSFKEECIERRFKELELNEKKFQERWNEIKLKDSKVEERLQELKLKEKQIQERHRKIELENKKSMERFKELESKSMERFKELESKSMERCKELESKSMERCKELESKSMERCKELESKERQLEDRHRKIDLADKKFLERIEVFELKEKQLDIRCREVELRERKFVDILNTKAKIESSDIFLHKTGTGHSNDAILCFSLKMDGKALQSFLNERWKEHDLMSNEVFVALGLSSDPPKLVLDAMHGFYPPHLKKGNVEFEEGVVRRSCILLLEQLMKMSTEIRPQVKKDALKLAFDWITRMRVDAEHSLEVLGFLQLLASYGLASTFDADELLNHLEIVAQHRQAPELFRVLGFADKISGFILNLIKTSKHIEAIRFIGAFKLVNEFPPGPLLKDYLKVSDIALRDIRMQNKSIGEQIETATKIIADLRDVLGFIEDHKIELKFSPEYLKQRIDFLEQQNSNRKMILAALDCEFQPPYLNATMSPEVSEANASVLAPISAIIKGPALTCPTASPNWGPKTVSQQHSGIKRSWIAVSPEDESNAFLDAASTVPWGLIPCQQSAGVSSNKGTAASMDGQCSKLQHNVHENFNVLCSEFSNECQFVLDSKKRVLDAIKSFYPLDLTYNNRYLVAPMYSCISSMEQLRRLSPKIEPQVKVEALNFALCWKAKVERERWAYLELEFFLEFVATYGLVSSFSVDELLKLLVAKLGRRKVVYYYQILGLADMIPYFVRRLIKTKQPIETIKYIYALDMVDKFPPVTILHDYLNGAKRKTARICWKGNSTALQIEAIKQEVGRLREVIDCIATYNLESEFSSKTLKEHIVRLEKQMETMKNKKNQIPRRWRWRGGKKSKIPITDPFSTSNGIVVTSSSPAACTVSSPIKVTSPSPTTSSIVAPAAPITDTSHFPTSASTAAPMRVTSPSPTFASTAAPMTVTSPSPTAALAAPIGINSPSPSSSAASITASFATTTDTSPFPTFASTAALMTITSHSPAAGLDPPIVFTPPITPPNTASIAASAATITHTTPFATSPCATAATMTVTSHSPTAPLTASIGIMSSSPSPTSASSTAPFAIVTDSFPLPTSASTVAPMTASSHFPTAAVAPLIVFTSQSPSPTADSNVAPAATITDTCPLPTPVSTAASIAVTSDSPTTSMPVTFDSPTAAPRIGITSLSPTPAAVPVSDLTTVSVASPTALAATFFDASPSPTVASPSAAIPNTRQQHCGGNKRPWTAVSSRSTVTSSYGNTDTFHSARPPYQQPVNMFMAPVIPAADDPATPSYGNANTFHSVQPPHQQPANMLMAPGVSAATSFNDPLTSSYGNANTFHPVQRPHAPLTSSYGNTNTFNPVQQPNAPLTSSCSNTNTFQVVQPPHRQPADMVLAQGAPPPGYGFGGYHPMQSGSHHIDVMPLSPWDAHGDHGFDRDARGHHGFNWDPHGRHGYDWPVSFWRP